MHQDRLNFQEVISSIRRWVTESATHLDRSDTPAVPGMHAMPDHVAAAIVIVCIVVIGIVIIAVVGIRIA